MNRAHVKLPIYNAEGMETKEHLEVSVHILQQLAKTSVVYKDHVGIVQGPTPEQEMGIINDIIDGRSWDKRILDATRLKRIDTDGIFNFLPERMETPNAHYRLEEDGTITQLVKQENLEWGPPIHDHGLRGTDEWRPIPGFSRYEMSPYKAIAEKATGKSVSIVKGGRVDNVLLSNDDGITKRMSVDHLFKQTFPEY